MTRQRRLYAFRLFRETARLFREKIRKWQDSIETRGADCVDSFSQARFSQDSNWNSKTAPVLVRISSNRRIRLSPAFKLFKDFFQLLRWNCTRQLVR